MTIQISRENEEKRKTPNAEPSSEITVVFPKNNNHQKDDHNKMLQEDIV